MILRLLLYLVALLRVSLQGSADCNIRVDILDGADLVEAVAIYLTDTTKANNAAQCAVDCYREKCDVAYFNRKTRQCRFTSDTSQSAPLPCSDIYAVETKEGIAELDKVKRYCMQCRTRVIGGSSSDIQFDPLKQVHSNKGEGRTDSTLPVGGRSSTGHLLPRRPLEIAPPTQRIIAPQALLGFARPLNRQAPIYPPKSSVIRNVSRQLRMHYGSTAKRKAARKQESGIVASHQWRSYRKYNITKRRHFGLMYRKNRRVSGYSYRKSYRPNHEHDRRTKLQALAKLNTAVYLKKKRKGWGNAK